MRFLDPGLEVCIRSSPQGDETVVCHRGLRAIAQSLINLRHAKMYGREIHQIVCRWIGERLIPLQCFAIFSQFTIQLRAQEAFVCGRVRERTGQHSVGQNVRLTERSERLGKLAARMQQLGTQQIGHAGIPG